MSVNSNLIITWYKLLKEVRLGGMVGRVPAFPGGPGSIPDCARNFNFCSGTGLSFVFFLVLSLAVALTLFWHFQGGLPFCICLMF